MLSEINLALRERIAHFLRVEIADGAPDFVALRVEENEGGSGFKTIHGRKFAANGFLDVEANEEELISKFLFELVNDGLYGCAGNSVWRLEFEQDGFACADHIPHHFGIVHERGLARVHDEPGRDQPAEDHTECKVIRPFWIAGEKYQPRHHCQRGGDQNEGILIKNRTHNRLDVCTMSCLVCDASHFDNSSDFFYNHATVYHIPSHFEGRVFHERVYH